MKARLCFYFGHFFAHVTHTPCITDHVITMLNVQTFFTRMERESMWHYGIAVDPGLLGKCHAMVWVWIDNRFENFAAILLSWILSDPHFSFSSSLPFLILSILTSLTKQKKSVREKLQIFCLLCSRATNVFFLRLIFIVFQGLYHLRKRHQLQKFVLLY